MEMWSVQIVSIGKFIHKSQNYLNDLIYVWLCFGKIKTINYLKWYVKDIWSTWKNIDCCICQIWSLQTTSSKRLFRKNHQRMSSKCFTIKLNSSGFIMTKIRNWVTSESLNLFTTFSTKSDLLSQFIYIQIKLEYSAYSLLFILSLAVSDILSTPNGLLF